MIQQIIPIAADIGNQQAALFGQACFKEGEMKSIYGTGNFILINAGDRRITSESKLLTTVFHSVEEGEAKYALEGSIFITGAAVQWLKDGFKNSKKC